MATSQFEIGDSTLGKETATGGEAVIRFTQGRAYLTANAFYTDYDNYIFEEETGGEEDGLEVFQFVGEDATFRGFEVQGGADLAKVGAFNVSVDALAEFVRAKTDSEDLPRIPPLSLLGGIEAESEHFKIRGEIDYAAEQDNITDHELPTDSYTLVNGFLTWKAPVGTQDVRLKLSVLNIFDEDARQHASFVKDLAPLPGRNVRFSIGTRF